jgi:hypothetical protein
VVEVSTEAYRYEVLVWLEDLLSFYPEGLSKEQVDEALCRVRRAVRYESRDPYEELDS